MALKNATIFAAVGLLIALGIDFAQWIALSFSLVQYQENVWLFRTASLASMLLKSPPMIIFFLVLYSKQKEG
jgi:hypothetical protein